MAVIPDGPMGVGMLFDAVRQRVWATPSGTPTFSVGQFGCQFNDGFSGTNQLTFTPTLPTPGAVFSISALIQADASAHGGFNNVLLSVGTAATEYMMVTGATGALVCGSPFVIGATSTVINMAGLTGWHRLGITCAGTAARFFLDGKFTDAKTVNGTLALANPACLTGAEISGNSSWGWNTADFFMWNRTLSDSEMQMNWIAPYRSVLRPKLSENQRVQRLQLPPWRPYDMIQLRM